jgi:hypothetical protein
VSLKDMRLRSGVEDEVRKVDSGRVVPLLEAAGSSFASVDWAGFEDALEAELEAEDAVEVEDEGA